MNCTGNSWNSYLGKPHTLNTFLGFCLAISLSPIYKIGRLSELVIIEQAGSVNAEEGILSEGEL